MATKPESKSTGSPGAPSPASGSAKAGGAPQPPAEPKVEEKKTEKKTEPKKDTTRRIGGHEVHIDPPAESVTPIAKCSVHGVDLVKGECPEPHEGKGGWSVVTEKK